MGPCVPTLEDVIEAIAEEMDGTAAGDNILTSDTTYEDVAEFYSQYQDGSTHELDLWIIDTPQPAREEEGGAIGELYSIFKIRIRYWSIRVASAAWSATARANAEAVRDVISGNQSIFAIDGNRQIKTPETCQLVSHGPINVGEPSQMIYESVLELEVESRRWA